MTHRWIKFLAKAKKLYFGGIWGIFPKNENFPESWLHRFLTLKTLQLNVKFHKNPEQFLRKTDNWPTDLLTNGVSKDHFRLKAGFQKVMKRVSAEE